MDSTINNDSQILDPNPEEVEKLLDESEEVEEKSDDRSLPSELFILPLNKRPFFPGMAAPILIESGPYYEVLKLLAKSSQKYIGLVLTKKEDADILKVGFNQLYRVGVAARILRIMPIEGGSAQILLSIEERIRIVEPLKDKYLKARVSYHKDNKELTEELKAYSISIVSVIKDLLKLNPLFKEELQIFLGHSDFTEPGKLADFSVALTTATREELQEVLETTNMHDRIDKALILLKKELDLSRLQSSINQKIEATITKSQKEFFLKEQLKTIKKELGLEKEDRAIDLEKFMDRLKKRQVPDYAMEVIQDEMEKLQTLETSSAEYTVCRNYLDWLTIIPWGIQSKEYHDLKKAEMILNKDHYGLEDIKQRILELISVGKLSKGLKGSIICLVGPPGVGKTSIGRSIAKVLHRKFFRFSVGGMRDEAEIKGHRRTYIGAMPGKMVQALKQSQAMNPVIMIDEVDKIGASYHGDPASALLEVLDPEQNKDFLDHYLDVRVDLSNVLFILTANVLDTIPDPLLDRMEILRLSGYILEEKLQIATKYLVPRARKEMGLTAREIAFQSEALKHMINNYAREAGVRTLNGNIKKVLRKVALKIVKNQEKTHPKHIQYKINVSNLQDYLGKPIFSSDRFYDNTPVGVATGLAWTSLGGATLYIESVQVPSMKTDMHLTGQAGDVMKESSQIAWTYLHSALERYAPGYSFFSKSQVHIHIPEGATPKDGPSAGVTMVTSLLSLLLDKPILENLGMTGEITLTGRVLGVGGIREKLIAARRSRLNVLIFPEDNRRDYEELPAYLKKGLKIHFVAHYDDVFKVAFPDIN
ncbi:Lon protease 1,DNA-binding ATP-dependent protease La,Archaeal serine proteases,ATP-dependent protease La,Lon protease (S16) C-terminal proteolytic domain [Chlamydia poikilotherma]|uniref:Lon protease n=1 Tax=Chlamydia poikilotherma TaxID=1967783 RepID=A0A3B0PRK4_9CHLA|nr:endopeptidase La [Chlamydia poikilotherma]SYX08808.1 Lon protease 1,DNA-binding ATP-dependent protease La,Archaeal serine proteases,ATP-dependent protease La,Lon protease (S16) C-terminal proteolytic domain [Chlamydia poikilotherma]